MLSPNHLYDAVTNTCELFHKPTLIQYFRLKLSQVNTLLVLSCSENAKAFMSHYIRQKWSYEIHSCSPKRQLQLLIPAGVWSIGGGCLKYCALEGNLNKGSHLYLHHTNNKHIHDIDHSMPLKILLLCKVEGVWYLAEEPITALDGTLRRLSWLTEIKTHWNKVQHLSYV